MNGWKLMAIGLAVSTAAGAAQAADFCKSNPYTKAEAAQGKVLFDSHCALCHQYTMVGREPGNDKNESPDINLLSAKDQEFVDNAGGVVPPLIGKAYFAKVQAKYGSVMEWGSIASAAAQSFPPTGKIEIPYTYNKIAAYLLYRNCGKALMKRWILATGLAAMAATGAAQRGRSLQDGLLFQSRGDRRQGAVRFALRALRHQYSMTGREPGNFRNESPDINTLSEGDLAFLDNAGGSVPPLIGAEVLREDEARTQIGRGLQRVRQQRGQQLSPDGRGERRRAKAEPLPYAYFKIAAYVLYRNCGKL